MAVARPGPAAPSDSHQIGRPGVKFRLAGTAAPAALRRLSVASDSPGELCGRRQAQAWAGVSPVPGVAGRPGRPAGGKPEPATVGPGPEPRLPAWAGPSEPEHRGNVPGVRRCLTISNILFQYLAISKGCTL